MTLRETIIEIEWYAGRRATVRPYMSPEERLAKIEALAEAALDIITAAPHDAIRVAITDAYYDARNAQETMETAADNARDAVLVVLNGA